MVVIKSLLMFVGLFVILQWCYAGETDTFYFKPSSLVYDTTPHQADTTQNTKAASQKPANQPRSMETTDSHYAEYSTYNAQGQEHLTNGEYEDAILNFQKVVELNPNDAVGYNNLGSAYSMKGDTATAMDCFNKSIDSDSTLASAYYNRGSLTLNYDTTTSGQDKNKLALADFTQSIALDSTKFDVFFKRGLVNTQLKDYNNAIADFTKAIELDSDNYNAYVQRAITYSLATEYTQALADYDKALDIKPFTSQIYFKKAEVYQAMGQKDNAIDEYGKVIFYAKTEDENLKNDAAAMIKKLQQEK